MYFVHPKGMAMLALLLTLPVAAYRNTAQAAPSSVSTRSMADGGAEVVEAWVTITDIYLQRSAMDEAGESGRVYLLQGASATRSLMDLADQAVGLIQAATVPEGTYSQLRIVISGGCVRTDGGDAFASTGFNECGSAAGSLQMPSWDASGLKIDLGEVVVTRPQRVRDLSFDVSEALGRAAGRSRWVTAPMIRNGGLGLTASVDVTLSPGSASIPSGVTLDEFSATLFTASNDSTRAWFADEDGDGVFELGFEFMVPADGPFDVRLNAPDGTTAEVLPASPATVGPASGGTGTVDWVLQSVTEDGGVECAWWICG